MSSLPHIKAAVSRDTAVPITFLENIHAGKPKQGTEVRVWRTDQHLHLEYQVTDNFILATKTGRDDELWEEEVVEFFVDPVGDLASYFEIEVNPLGAVVDLVLRKNRSGWLKDIRWDCKGLKASIATNDRGWSCEIAIPFASITDTLPVSGTTWRVNFLRIDRPRNEPRELSAWSPTLSGTFHVAQRFGFLEF